jgi:hypothetical protein
MKYILILLFYIIAFIVHLMDAIIRTIFNTFIFLWDFKLSGEAFYSYKKIYDFEKGGMQQRNISEHYSLKQFKNI